MLRKTGGKSFLTVYADDFITGFQYKADAEKYYVMLKERLRKFNLELEESKSCLIEFGRFTESNCKRREVERQKYLIIPDLSSTVEMVVRVRNSKRVKFTGTKNNQELYFNPKKHFISFLKGIVVFLIIAVIDRLILSVF